MSHHVTLKNAGAWRGQMRLRSNFISSLASVALFHGVRTFRGEIYSFLIDGFTDTLNTNKQIGTRIKNRRECVWRDY